MTVELLDLSEPEYRAMPAVNWSALKHMDISPAQYIWEMEHPTEATSAMALGTIEHSVVMESDKYFDKLKKFDGANRGTKKFDAFCDANPSSIIVTVDEYEMLLLHLDRFRKNKHYEQITENAKIEQCLRWTDLETGLVCKCRPDMFNDLVLVDLKTSRHIIERDWWWDFKKKRYHAQFAFYYDALRLLDGIERVCMVVKLETSPCFDVVYYPLPDVAIVEGRAHYRRLLNELRDCLEVNAWPGKCDELAHADFDNWVIDKAA